MRNPVTFTQLADAAFNQIREYGRTSRYVTLRIMHTIKRVAAYATTSEQRKALMHHATLTEGNSRIGLPDPADRQVITDEYEAVKKILNPQ